jgi:crotonobetainyl-CoA:carnitine CoA-transferase CaiB-like acyl-CoA transferase
VAITVFTEAEWESFCKAIGNPLWTKDERFSSLALCKNHEDELEQLVGEWTISHENTEITELLQAAGVPAGVVQDARDVLESDQQLKERNFLICLTHPVLG